MFIGIKVSLITHKCKQGRSRAPAFFQYFWRKWVYWDSLFHDQLLKTTYERTTILASINYIAYNKLVTFAPPIPSIFLYCRCLLYILSNVSMKRCIMQDKKTTICFFYVWRLITNVVQKSFWINDSLFHLIGWILSLLLNSNYLCVCRSLMRFSPYVLVSFRGFCGDPFQSILKHWISNFFQQKHK